MAELVCRPDQHEQWLDARRQGVTATDVVTLAGLASWDSPFALYWRKKGLLPEVAQSPRMRLGLWLEDQIAEAWAEALNIDPVCLSAGGLYRSDERPWQLATPDFLVVNDDVLEVKTASSRDGWGDDGSDEVPARVRAQVLWQMDTLGVSVGHVAVCFLPSGEIRSYTISLDDGLDIQDYCATCDEIDGLRDLGFGFMARLIRDEPPPVDGLPATTEALKHLHAGYTPKTTAEIGPLTADFYRGACDKVSEWEREKRKWENEVRQAMGEAQLAVDPVGLVVARREVYKRREYVVPAGVVDRLVRVKPKETTDASSE